MNQIIGSLTVLIIGFVIAGLGFWSASTLPTTSCGYKPVVSIRETLERIEAEAGTMREAKLKYEIEKGLR